MQASASASLAPLVPFHITTTGRDGCVQAEPSFAPIYFPLASFSLRLLFSLMLSESGESCLQVLHFLSRTSSHLILFPSTSFTFASLTSSSSLILSYLLSSSVMVS